MTDQVVAERKRAGSIRRRLLDWFAEAQRDLPWRGTLDPYAILVSELMLQQTQVRTVIPYYERFLNRFPTLASLAEASEEEVLRHWSGLGYYRRARHLHRLAREVLLSHDGRIPRDKRLLLALPGIGPYTAGAILSIAQGLPEPLVDGNVERVLARLFRIRTDLATAAGKRLIWELAAALVPGDRPGEFNQALMELGATLCLPKAPKCPLCPLSTACAAFRTGAAEELPVKTRSKRTERVEEVVLLGYHQGRWLLVDRNEEGLYSGMWQFPWIWRASADSSLKETLARLVKTLSLEVDHAEAFHTLKHAVTFRSIRTTFFRMTLSKPSCALASYEPEWRTRWRTVEELRHEALPGYQRRVLALLERIEDEDPHHAA